MIIGFFFVIPSKNRIGILVKETYLGLKGVNGLRIERRKAGKLHLIGYPYTVYWINEMRNED